MPKQFLVGYDAPGEIVATVIAALLALFALYLLARKATPAERRGVKPLAVLAAVVVGVPAVLSVTGADYLITRNVIVALVPALVVLAGYGAARAGWAGIAAAATLAAIGVAMCVEITLDKRYQRDDWRGVAERLGRPGGTRLLVVSPVNGRVPLEVYLPRARKQRPEEHVPITELDVVGFTPRGPGDPSDPPRPPSRRRCRAVARAHRGGHLHARALPQPDAAAVRRRPALRQLAVRAGRRAARAAALGAARAQHVLVAAAQEHRRGPGARAAPARTCARCSARPVRERS